MESWRRRKFLRLIEKLKVRRIRIMDKMKIKILAVFLILTASLSQASLKTSTATQCDPDVLTHVKSLEKSLNTPEPWPTIPRSDFRTAFIGSDERVYLFGYSTNDIVGSGIRAKSCENNAKLFHLESDTSAVLKSKPFGFLEPKDWLLESNRSPESNSMYFSDFPLITYTQKPLFVISTPFPYPSDFESFAFSTFEERAAVHENFHEFQIKLFKNVTPDGSRNLRPCFADAHWTQALSDEFLDWSLLANDLAQLEKPEILNTVKRIIDRRFAHGQTANQKHCWQTVASWERMEGTAQYVETSGSFAAGYGGRIDMWSVFEELGAEYLKPRPGRLEFFYVTGARLCRVLDRLTGAKEWQIAIQAGKSPIEVLREIIYPSSIGHSSSAAADVFGPPHEPEKLDYKP